MKRNMGTVDRIARILAAVLVAVLFFTGVISGVFAYILIGLAAVFLVTSIAGNCPLYTMLGIKTCATKHE